MPNAVDIEVRGRTARLRRDLAQANQTIQRFAKVARAAFAGGGAVLILSQLNRVRKAYTDIVDEISLQRSLLRLVSNDASELARTEREVFRVAQATRTEYTATAQLYARIARSSEEFGAEQADILKVSQAINQAFRVGGATQREAFAATIQLGQGLASGQLRGEELRSVLEQAPRLARAIADGLGIGIGQLRVMGFEGKLLARDVFGSILSQTEKINAEFGQIERTTGQAQTQLSNSLRRLADSFDRSTNAGGLFRSLLDTLKESAEATREGIDRRRAPQTFDDVEELEQFRDQQVRRVGSILTDFGLSIEDFGDDYTRSLRRLQTSLSGRGGAGQIQRDIIRVVNLFYNGIPERIAELREAEAQAARDAEREANLAGSTLFDPLRDLARGAVAQQQRLAARRIQQRNRLRGVTIERDAVDRIETAVSSGLVPLSERLLKSGVELGFISESSAESLRKLIDEEKRLAEIRLGSFAGFGDLGEKARGAVGDLTGEFSPLTSRVQGLQNSLRTLDALSEASADVLNDLGISEQRLVGIRSNISRQLREANAQRVLGFDPRVLAARFRASGEAYAQSSRSLVDQFDEDGARVRRIERSIGLLGRLSEQPKERLDELGISIESLNEATKNANRELQEAQRGGVARFAATASRSFFEDLAGNIGNQDFSNLRDRLEASLASAFTRALASEELQRAISGGLGNLLRYVFSGITNGASGFVGTLRTARDFLFGSLGRAEFGGPQRPGVPIMVGERGAEVFMPYQSGYIISNRELRKMFGAMAIPKPRANMRWSGHPRREFGGPVPGGSRVISGERGIEAFLPYAGGRGGPFTQTNNFIAETRMDERQFLAWAARNIRTLAPLMLRELQRRGGARG